MKSLHAWLCFVALVYVQRAFGCCDDGWVSFGESCYLFADEIKVDWSEGSHFCASHGNAYIVTIESSNEELFLRDQCRRLFKDGADRSNFFYIGAKDDEVEGVWRWYTTNELVDDGYVNWAPGQPQDSATHNQDCAVLWGRSGYLWEDFDCETQSHIICEKPMFGEPEVIGRR